MSLLIVLGGGPPATTGSAVGIGAGTGSNAAAKAALAALVGIGAGVGQDVTAKGGLASAAGIGAGAGQDVTRKGALAVALGIGSGAGNDVTLKGAFSAEVGIGAGVGAHVARKGAVGTADGVGAGTGVTVMRKASVGFFTTPQIQYHELRRESFIGLGDLFGDADEAGEVFVGDGFQLASLTAFMRRTLGTDGSWTAAVYASTGTPGVDAKPTGAPLAVSTNSVPTSSIPTSFTAVQFQFSGFTPAVGVNYFAVIREPPSASVLVDVGLHQGDPIAGRNAAYKIGGTWVTANLAFNLTGIIVTEREGGGLGENEVVATWTVTVPPAAGGGDIAMGFGQVWDLRAERETADELEAVRRDDEEVLIILSTVLPKVLK